MQKLLTVLALAATAALLSTSALAGNGVAKPPKPAKVAKPDKTPTPTVSAAASVHAILTDTTLSLVGTGLTPGDHYAYTFQVWGVDDVYPTMLGGSTGTAVRDDGTFTIGFDVAELREWRSPLVKVVMWLRSVGSHVGDVSVNADGEQLIVTQTF